MKRRRRRLKRPVHISDLIGKQARRWRFQSLHKIEVIRLKWPEAAGDFVSNHVQPVRLIRKSLRLLADDSSWNAEMAYLSDSILERLKELLPGDWVEEFKVVVGEPEEVRAIGHANNTFKPAKVSSVRQKQVQELAGTLEDDDLAGAIERAMLAWVRRLDATQANAVSMKPTSKPSEDGDDR